MSKRKGIGYSPISDKVYLGQQDQKKGMWIGIKEDITNRFLNIVFEYFPENTTRIIGTGENRNMFMNVPLDSKSIKSNIKALQEELDKL